VPTTMERSRRRKADTATFVYDLRTWARQTVPKLPLAGFRFGSGPVHADQAASGQNR
jgi:hypothetical protein